MEKNHSFKRILVVKLADIGDLLTATPALRALRESFPMSHISILVTPNASAVLEGCKLVDDIITFDKHRYDRVGGSVNMSAVSAGIELFIRFRREAYDCVVVLHHLVTRWGALKYAILTLASGAPCRVGLDNGRGWFLTHRTPDNGFGFMHEVEYSLAIVGSIGAKTANIGLEMNVGPEDLAAARSLLKETSSRPVVAIHPGSGVYSLLRRWPAEYFAQLGDLLASCEGASIVIVGGPGEVELCEQVAAGMRNKPLILAGKTSLKQLAALLKQCDLFVGNDSGVMHIAAAMRTRVVAIFGPSNHLAWAPWTAFGAISEKITSNGAIVRGISPCAPCLYGADWGRRRNVSCSTVDCLRRITPDIVLGVTRKVLREGIGSRE